MPGIALGGAEKDFSGDAWRASRTTTRLSEHEKWRAPLRNGETINFRKNIERWHEAFTWANEDDLSGGPTQNLTFPSFNIFF